MHIFGKHVQQILVENGTVVNIMPATTMCKLAKKDNEQVAANVVVMNFMGGSYKLKDILSKRRWPQ